MSTKPRWSPDDAKRRARIAYRLATKHQAAVEPRLSPGLLAQLAADRAALGDASVGSLSALATQKTATATERDLAAKGHRLALRVREVIRRSPNAPAHLWAALGIGDALRPGDTAGVAAALDALASQAAALAAHGILPSDIAKAQALSAQLKGADASQDASRDARAVAIEDRVDAQLRLERAVDQIASRGAMAFDEDVPAEAVIVERFERLVSASGPTAEDETDAGPEPAPAPAPSPPPAA